MAKLETLKDVLIEELKDIYNAEHQLLKALPRLESKAAHEEMKEVLREHVKDTDKQVRRLEEVASIFGVPFNGKTCKAMQGLISEAEESIARDASGDALIDALIIGAVQRIEHYEISAYGTARAMAEALELDEVASLLEETLDEEVALDDALSEISEDGVLTVLKELDAAREEVAGDGYDDEAVRQSRSRSQIENSRIQSIK